MHWNIFERTWDDEASHIIKKYGGALWRSPMSTSKRQLAIDNDIQKYDRFTYTTVAVP